MKQALARILRSYWKLRGGRNVRVFGHSYRFTPNTEFPIRPVVPFPKEEYRSNIVRYADLVQFHCACRILTDSESPPIVVDVGAHHGTYAVVLGKIVQERGGAILAIEPNPKSYRVLQENVRLNNLEDTVQCVPFAVMDECGQIELDENGSSTRVNRSLERSGISTDATTLRVLLAKHRIGRVNLLQIDVEGAELPVLLGYPWDEIPLDNILCELHPYAWAGFGYDPIAFREFLASHQFRCIDTFLVEHLLFSELDYIGPTRLISAANPHSALRSENSVVCAPGHHAK